MPKRCYIKLDDEQKKQLERWARNPPKLYLRYWAQAILRVAAGEPICQVVEGLQMRVHRNAVSEWETAPRWCLLGNRAFMESLWSFDRMTIEDPGMGEDAAFDLILVGGRVIDGTGAPGRPADVGIRGDRIAAVGDLSAMDVAVRRDVTGLTVAPGFIDTHTHDDNALLLTPGFTLHPSEWSQVFFAPGPFAEQQDHGDNRRRAHAVKRLARARLWWSTIYS